ncbi:hypothetical protein F3Y22_tig00002840pilonHSYRG01219 [Hibiscus syriacus]|uniref:Uncharacterized protein n=1 Tax=Hibiscus syriacus TaxID=106335 RepID=A0A6A3CSF3_HIBSY|nr:hypothetical protein F3Y22_tig00002840pilonHSYRG01219 [Hibiscus syriacus]
MEITGVPPPSWQQSTTRRRQPPSPISFTPSILILLPITALLVSLSAVPHFLSTVTHILRPVGAKKNWDSLNVVLVSFAILCGVFARRNDDKYINRNDDDNNNNNNNEIDRPSHIVSQQWFEYSERLMSAPDTRVTTLKRSSRSYPNLRQDVSKNDNEDRTCRSDFEECEINIIPVNTFVSPPLSAPSPPPASRPKPSRTYQNDGGENVMDKKDQADRFKQIKSSQPVILPLPPPLFEMGNIAKLPALNQSNLSKRWRENVMDKKIKLIDSSKSSLHSPKRKKLKDHNHQQESPCIRHTSHPLIILLYLLHHHRGFHLRSFKNTISSESAAKSTFSISTRLSKQNTEIPPPPTLPQVLVSTKRLSNQNNQTPPPEPSRRRATTDSLMPPSTKNVNTNYCEEKMSIGGQFPLIPMPPPLPFKMPEFENTDIDVSSGKDDVVTDSMMDDPDVNAKAETFIARLKDGWKLEKINSMKDKLNHTSSEIQQLQLMNK